MYSKKLLLILLALSLIFVIAPLTTFAEAEIDMGHNCKEDFKLRFNDWYVGPCKNNKATCIKNLMRYDGIEKFDAFLRNLEKTAEAEKEETFWMPLLEKFLIGAGVTGAWGACVYLAPISTILTTSGTIILGSTMYNVHDNVIEPVSETAGFFTKGFVRLKDWILRVEKPKEPDKGLFGNAKDTLFGDKSKENVNEGLLESIRKLIFGDRIVTILTKEQKKAFVNGIRKELYTQVKDKKWLNNKMLLLSIDIDPKVMQFGLKFDNVSFSLNYKDPVKNYFKKIKE